MAAITFAFILSIAHLAQSQVCYWPNGEIAAGYVTCPGWNDTLTSWPCCNSGGEWPYIDPCLSNGFCFSSNIGGLYRGACTDRSYTNSTDSNCVQRCRGVNDQGTAVVSLCVNNDLCCTKIDDGANNGCCSGPDVFQWDDATFTGPLNASTLMNVTDVRSSIPGTDAASETVTVTPSAGNTSSSSEDTYSQGAIIGIGVGLGVPLILALVTVARLLLVLKRERQNKTSQVQGKAQGSLDSTAPQQNVNGFGTPSPYSASLQNSNGFADHSGNGYGYPQEQKPYGLQPQFMPAQPVSELDHDRTPAEVPGN